MHASAERSETEISLPPDTDQSDSERNEREESKKAKNYTSDEASSHLAEIMTGDTVTHRKVFSCALLALLLLTLPIHSQGQFCPGEIVSSFNCTTVIAHVWSGSALAGQCPSNETTLTTASVTTDEVGESNSCGIFTATITNITPVMGGLQLSSTISFTASSDLDGTAVVCRDGGQNEVESYPITIIGPPTAPDITMMVNFIVPREQFTIRWNGTAVVSATAVTGFQVDSPSGITCDDTSSSPSAMESRCSWDVSAIGQTHPLTVSAINCGSQQGPPSQSVSVNLQVPEAPTLTACPVYNQSGLLLRIESSCTTVPAVVIADGVDGSPDVYTFSYNDGDDSVIPSGQCTGGNCTDEFTPDPAVSQYTVSVTARNVVGEGPPDTAGPITTTNNFVAVTIDLTNEDMEVTCTFLSGFTGTAECRIEYSTQEDLSGSVVDMGNSTSGDTVTVNLPPLNEVTYYYIVTATADDMTVRVQGFFRTNCLASELGEEDTTLNQNCPESSNGSVQISAGRACYSGLVPGATAEYVCNCPQYRLEGTGNRTCQNDGSWSGTVPQCLPECDSFPSPVNDNSRFVGPIDCQPDNPLVNATYGCGRGKEDITIQFLTPADGECSWEDPPCKVVYAAVLGIMGASFYGSIVGNFFTLIIGFLCYRPKQTWLIPFIIIVSFPLPVLGLAWAWWLVRERVPVVSSIDKDKSFVRKWWRAILIAIGVFLYLLYLAIFIALAAIFAPQNVLPSDGDFGLLFFGFTIAIITFLFWIVAVNLLCCLPRPVPEGADETDYCKAKKKKTGDVEMTTAADYGKLEHGVTTPPAIADPTDPMYSHLAGDKAGEASAEEYSQLQRQNAPKGVPNIGDPSYSHLQGGAGQQQYNELQHGKPPTVPPHVVEDYSQLKPDAPLVYSEVQQGPRWQSGASKKKSSTDL